MKSPCKAPLLAVLTAAGLPFFQATDLAAAPTKQPTSKDITVCEKNTRAFLSADYTGDNSVAVRYFTKEFAKLWLWACNPPPGETNYWGADPILETQDDEPARLSLGPGVAKSGNIEVPVVYRHRGARPFTKTFVFTDVGGTWRISDIVSSGDIPETGSEFAKLRKAKGN